MNPLIYVLVACTFNVQPVSGGHDCRTIEYGITQQRCNDDTIGVGLNVDELPRCVTMQEDPYGPHARWTYVD